MTQIDFKAHNERVRQVWDAYYSGNPVRVPMILGVNPRYYLLNPALNTKGITFEEYSNDPDLMVQVQIQFQHYVRHNLLQDAEMGLPEHGWAVYVDLQNYYEAAWFGAEIHYYRDQVPDTRPFLSDDNKRELFDRGLPDPFAGGLMQKNLRFYEHIKERLSEYVYFDRPAIGVSPAAAGTDGPFTTACNIRGASEICLDIYEDPDYVRELLDYITQATIQRIKAYRQHYLGLTETPQSFGFADDSIEMLSTDVYRELVLPFHKRLVNELSKGGPNSIHLCGNATRHFKTIRDELNVNAFDTGFPVDFAWLRQELGPDVYIYGGPTVQMLMHASPGDIDAEVRRILESGITDGGKFILREANNLSPCIPVENTNAMYQAVCKYGIYKA